MRFSDPMTETPEGRLLAISRDLLKSVEKNTNCMHKADETCKNCYPKKGYKSDRGQGKKPKLSGPKGNKNKLAKGKGCSTGKNCALDDDGKCICVDKTSEFLRERGIIAKYEQEHSVDNQVPQFMEISGKSEIRAAGYTTNQRIPYMNELDSPKPISEVAKMPKVAQTGYDINDSSLHMHLNVGGDLSDNRAPIEESLAELKIMKAGGQLGVVEEIAGLVEEVYARL